MAYLISYILFATLEFTVTKDIESPILYKIFGSDSSELSIPQNPEFRLLPVVRNRREASDSSGLPVQNGTLDARSTTLSTTKPPTAEVPAKMPLSETVPKGASPAFSSSPLTPSKESPLLLTTPLGFTLQPTTPNFTVFEDDHRYYRSRAATTEEQVQFWIDEKTMYTRHETLSESYRSAATVHLSFTFTFYGHEVHQITIATGGFLYMSEFLHQWLTATQYIAPLMANFDTQLGNTSQIHYMDNGTVFVVWWENVYLQDNHNVGFFSFQVMLHKDGRIIFSYKQIPVDINRISDERHPVKVGLSDAFAMISDFFYLRQRTIYEYHRVEINMSQVVNNSAVIITPLPTCLSLKTCEDCINMSSTVTSSFQCHWCPSLGKCSDGLDRNRQEWLDSECDQSFPDTADKCTVARKKGWHGSRLSFRTFAPSGGVNIATAIIIMAVFMLIGGVVMWIVYAYKNPNTRSGMWLIQHRPNNLIERIRDAGRGSRITSKYEVAMQPEAESFA